MSRNFELMRRAGLEIKPESGDLPSRLAAGFPEDRSLGAAPFGQEKAPEWMRAIAVLMKHWRLSATFAAIVIVTATVVTYSIKPVYEPTARIEVDPPGETFSLDGGSGAGDPAYLETQAQNLKSDRLAVEVIRKLRLDQNADLVPDAQDRADTNPASISKADATNLTGAENAALGTFQKNLAVKRDSASRLVSVSFASHEAGLAAQVTNSVLDTFIQQTFQDQHDDVVKSTEWLSKQLDDIRQRMEESNRVLAEYQSSIGVAELDDNKNSFAEQLSDLSRQLTQAQVDRITMQALLKNVHGGTPDSLPEVRSNPVVQHLSEQLADVKGQLSQAKVLYGVNHPSVKKLQSQAIELESQLSSQKLAILSSLHTNYSAAQAREQLMSSQIKGATEQLNRMGRYNALKKEAQANSELYNALYAKVKEAGISAASKSSNLRIVDAARVLTFPTHPNRILNLAVGIMAGLLGGIAVAFLREQMDRRIFSPGDVRQYIGNSNVAILPRFSVPGDDELLAQDAIMPANRNLAPEARFLMDRPNSPEAEALRSLSTSLMLSHSGTQPQAVLVVSAFPGEGKTTVAVNLAIAMAQHGRTCVLDADLRRGHVAEVFGIPGKLGLTDVLQGTISLDRALVEAPGMAGLTILPSHPGSINAAQLVCSDAMRRVLQELRQRFQFVIIDSAPILPVADGRVLSTIADGLIFVGRSGKTTRDVVRRSLEILNEVHAAPILQFVVNDADLNSASYRDYQYGYSYYSAVSEK